MPKKFSLSSMTACGFGEAVSKKGRFTAEIQSVNRRYLDLKISLPQSAPSLEAELRSLVGEKLSRGQIFLKLSWHREDAFGFKPNLQLAKELKEGWEAIAAELELDVPFDLNLIAREKELFYSEESQFPEKQAIESVEAALSELVEMREAEGEKLAEDLHKRIVFLQKSVKEIEASSKDVANRYREKLVARFADLGHQVEDDERILKEIVLFADRADVTEEIVRFKIHLEKFKESLEAGGPCGKKLDFLIQELLRESNTMGAKGQMTVEIKCELEKMREQVQNIE